MNNDLIVDFVDHNGNYMCSSILPGQYENALTEFTKLPQEEQNKHLLKALFGPFGVEE